jgi:hypothetical protein
MDAAVLASVGALTAYVALPALAEEQTAARNLRANQHTIAKNDGCEAFARNGENATRENRLWIYGR